MHELILQSQLMDHVKVGDLNEVLLAEPFWGNNTNLKCIICETAVVYNQLEILKYMLGLVGNDYHHFHMLKAMLHCNFEAMELIALYTESIPWKAVLDVLPGMDVFPELRIMLEHVKMLKWMFDRMPLDECYSNAVVCCLTQLPVMCLDAFISSVVPSHNFINKMTTHPDHYAYMKKFAFTPVLDQLVCLPIELSRRHICVFL